MRGSGSGEFIRWLSAPLAQAEISVVRKNPNPADAARTVPWLDQELNQDLANARKANVDITVFGIALGQTLTLPGCQSIPGEPTCEVRDATAGAPSASAGDMTPNQAAQMLGLFAKKLVGGPSVDEVSGVSTSSVFLGDKPDWLPIPEIEVTRANGKVVAIRVTGVSNDQEDTVEETISGKYNRPASGAGVDTCRNGYGVVVGQFEIRKWAMPGLEVRYEPTTLCNGVNWRGAGNITFKTNAYLRLEAEAHAKKASAHLKL